MSGPTGKRKPLRDELHAAFQRAKLPTSPAIASQVIGLVNDPRSTSRDFARVIERDLAGHVLKEGGWTHLCLPARYEPEHPSGVSGDQRREPGELLWPERFGESEIREMEIRLGAYGTAGQLQQRPAPREGGMFEPHWFEIVRMAPADAGAAPRQGDVDRVGRQPGRQRRGFQLAPATV